MTVKRYAKEFDTVDEFHKFLRGAENMVYPRRGNYTVEQYGTRRKITEETADGELIVVDVYYVTGWDWDE